jgi:hypothetical protein
MKLTRLLALLLPLMLFTAPALAGKVALPKKIFIAPVEMPKKPDIVGRGAILAALLGGPLGAFAADGANKDIETVYAEHLAKNHIDVGADITFELMEQLAARGFELVGSADQAEAILTVHLASYGLTAKGSTGSIPFITPNIVVRNREGKRLAYKLVVWSLVKEVERTVQPKPVADYFTDPALLRDQMRKMNTLMIREGLNKL